MEVGMTHAKYYTTATPPCCSCRDWEFRGSRTGTLCKHIQRLREAEALLDANRVKWSDREK